VSHVDTFEDNHDRLALFHGDFGRVEVKSLGRDFNATRRRLGRSGWSDEHRRDHHRDEQGEQNKLQFHAGIPL